MSAAPKKVLITGAGGAIGVHVVAHLLTHTNWSLVATDSFHSLHKGSRKRLEKIAKEFPEWSKRVRVFKQDLNRAFSKKRIREIGRVDYIINLASRSDVQHSIDDPMSFVDNNVRSILTMLEYARAIKPRVFMHFSTDEVYGPAPKRSRGHKEWDPILPSNPYAASKACQEALAIAWWRCYNIPLIITNTMNDFGEMQAASKFPAMIQKKINGGKLIDVHAAGKNIGSRYYIHSRNTADAILFILKHVKPYPHKPGNIDRPVRLHIVGDRQIDNLELVKLIGALMGKKAIYRLVDFHKHNPGHDLHYGLDGRKMKKLGWKSPLSFEKSMKETIRWQQRHKEWI